MTQRILANILLTCATILGFVLIAYACSGCTAARPQAAQVVAPTGTDIDKAGAYVTSAESAVQAAIPHSDPVGKSDLGLASTAHKAVVDSLGKAKVDLAGVQAAIQADENLIVGLKNQVGSLLSSWGYRFQVITTRIFVILCILVGLHLVAGVVAIFAPPPYGTIAGVVSKVVNPLGWFTWLVAHVQANVAFAPPTTAVITAAKGIL